MVRRISGGALLIWRLLSVSGDRRRWFVASAAFIGLAASFGLAEAGARLAGFSPFQPSVITGSPYISEDPVLGWAPKPGRHNVVYPFLDEPVPVTILEDGSRRTAAAPVEGPEVLLLGGSYTFGYGLRDEQTLGWKLQANDPTRRYVNRGVVGFGSYQALLALERRLETAPPPQAVIYGMIGHHEIRNIAYGYWPYYLTSSSRGAMLPYADVDEDDNLLRRPAVRPTPLPFRETLAIVHLVDGYRMKALTRGRLHRRVRVMNAILAEMNRACEEVGSAFAVALLDNPGEGEASLPFLRDSGIALVDLRRGGPDLRLKGEGVHPGDALTTIWAEELGAFVRPLTEQSETAH